jgi:NhaC family Na+:H+ antiporter
MMATTVPAMLIALTVYLVAGYYVIEPVQTSLVAIDSITQGLASRFQLGWIPLLPALLVITLAISRIDPLPALFSGVLAGALVAIFYQGVGLHDVFSYAQSGFKIETGVAAIDKLLNAGGIQSMMWTISLMLIALGFGGALERTGCLESIIQSIVSRVKSFGAVQCSAIGTAFATNLVAGDPYISIALPGRMYSPLYRGMGYSTLNLSRAVEEGGTLMSPLIPWNAGGAFVISALGLGIMEGNLQNLMYIPLAFACWTAPVIGMFYAVTGLFSPLATDADRAHWETNDEKVMDLSDNEHLNDAGST